MRREEEKEEGNGGKLQFKETNSVAKQVIAVERTTSQG